MCINVDTTKVTQQLEYLQNLLPGLAKHDNNANVSSKLAENLSSDEPAEATEHIIDMVTNIIDNILKDCIPALLSREEKIEKIRFMDAKGIFLMKGSIELVAEKMQVNKVTVYSYLDEARGKR